MTRQRHNATENRQTTGTLRKWWNVLVLLAACLVAVVLCEAVLRHRYAHFVRTPPPEVLAIQQYLELDPDIGFKWKPNIDARDNIVFDVADVEYDPLSTDEFGFMNPSGAIERRRHGDKVNVIGLGDSFIEHACHVFYESFQSEGIFYYGMAIHRQCPPQYNAILRKFAVPQHPDWVIYGLFENDFAETSDFENWRRSGLDWFAYHSGTWCGPAVGKGFLGRALTRHLRGFHSLYRVILAKMRGDAMTVAGPTEAQVRQVADEVLNARELAAQNGIRFLLLLVPSKHTAVRGASNEAEALDRLQSLLSGQNIAVLDLRESFARVEDPASLYYNVDGHWRKAGICLAADAILRALRDLSEP